MTGAQRAGVATVAGLMAALSVVAAPPAQAAAGPGWRVVWTHRFASPPEYGSLDSVVSTGRNNAWAFGSTDVVGLASGTPVAEHWSAHTRYLVALGHRRRGDQDRRRRRDLGVRARRIASSVHPAHPCGAPARSGRPTTVGRA